MLKHLILFFVIVSLLSCNKTTRSDAPENSPDQPAPATQSVEQYKMIAADKYQNNVRYSLNDDSTYVICTSVTKSVQLKITRFFIFDIANDKVLFEDSVINGSVAWLNATQVQIYSQPGIVKGDESETAAPGSYIFDVVQQKRIAPAG